MNFWHNKTAILDQQLVKGFVTVMTTYFRFCLTKLFSTFTPGYYSRSIGEKLSVIFEEQFYSL